MNLKESKFYYAGEALNFVVFSDYPYRVKYVESIRLFSLSSALAR